MKRRTRLIGNFARFGTIQLLDKAKHIANCLNGTPHITFTTEVPFYDDLQQAIEVLETTNEQSKTNKTVITERNIAKENLMTVLNKIKAYLEAFYGDDPALLATTGFDLSKDPQPVPEPGAPINFGIQVGHIGCIDLKVQSAKGAKAYEFCYKLENDSNWISFSQATPKCTIQGLESGSKYDFRVAYVGKTATKVYSNVLSTFIL